MKRTLVFLFCFALLFASFSLFALESAAKEGQIFEKEQETAAFFDRLAAVMPVSLADPFDRLDLDRDSEWSVSDVAFLLNFLSQMTEQGDPDMDVNGDGVCNIVDVNSMLNAFSGGCLHKKAVDPALSASCREQGLTEGSHCLVCGQVFVPQSATPSTAHLYVGDVCYFCGLRNPVSCKHQYGSWQTVTAAGCDTEGLRTRTCPLCETTEEQVIGPVGHNFSTWTIEKEATIFEEGEQIRTCLTCGKTETKVIPVYVPTDAEKKAMALKVAQEIADYVAQTIPNGTDLEKVELAAWIVSDYCDRCVYTTEGKDYKQAYGVFIKGEYSCAGSTRALGMVLECMGYTWTHKNENQWSHQWCILEMDGQIGYADGQIGWAGYGKHPLVDDD